MSAPPLGLKVSPWSPRGIENAGYQGVIWSDQLLCETPLHTGADGSSCGLVLRECTPAQGDGRARMSLVTFGYDAKRNEVEVHRVAHSGRAVYYWNGPDGSIVFSSHLKLLRHMGVPFEFDQSVMAELLTYRHACAPRTLVKDVSQLAAGDVARCALEHGRWRAYRIRVYSPAETNSSYRGGADDPALVRALNDALEDATLATGATGGALGTPLSGGMDSSVLTAILTSKASIKQTFSCGYPFERLSTDTELQYATSAAQALGTEHRVHIPTMSEYLHGVIEGVHLAEQPLMHLQSVLFYLMMRDVMPGATVVPCGEGADGMFGGRLQRLLSVFARHPMYQWFLRVPGVAASIQAVSKRTNRLGLLARVSDRKLSPATSLTDPAHVLWSLAVFGDTQWITDYLHCRPQDLVGERATVMRAYTGRDLRDCTSILAFLSETSETQTMWNKLGEGCGKCVTYPFLDPKVSDLVYATPWDRKLEGTKPLLRAVARLRGIPETIVSRPKASFDIDPNKWGPQGGVFEPLLGLAMPIIGENILRSLQSGYVFKAHTLWTMLNHAIWVRLFIKDESPEKLHGELDQEMERLGVTDAFRTKGRVESSSRAR
jgi:asparagine synthetase B (glutamine-hydrolysing)